MAGSHRVVELSAHHMFGARTTTVSHQDPGFIDHVANKRAEVARIYLPPDANTLLAVASHCLASRNYINVIIAGKDYAPVWLNPEQAVLHCARGLDIFEWASTDHGTEPDVVFGCAGDVPTLEVLAATSILRHSLPALKVRVVNVVDLFRLQSDSLHPHGMTDAEYDTLFAPGRPVIFAYHGYPALIHRLTYRRNGHENLHVRGYLEEGTTTTPFDMLVLNKSDRFQLVIDAISTHQSWLPILVPPDCARKWPICANATTNGSVYTEKTSRKCETGDGIRKGIDHDHSVPRRRSRNCAHRVADLIESAEDLSVVGQASTVAEAMARIPAAKPDIAVLDMRLPDGNGIELCRDLRSQFPDLNCLMLTSFTDEQAMLDAIMAGAGGYVIKDIKGMELVSAIRIVGTGQSCSTHARPQPS